MKNKIYLAFGSNLDNRDQNIKKAVSLLQKKLGLVKLSSFYETKPEYYANQPEFLNCAALFTTNLDKLELIKFTKQIEKKIGREKTFQMGPRKIDIDIIYFNNDVYNTENIVLPHPKMHERMFVLEPLEEIECDVIHPVLGMNIRQLIQQNCRVK